MTCATRQRASTATGCCACAGTVLLPRCMNIVCRQLAASDHTRSTPAAEGPGCMVEVVVETGLGVVEKAARELPSGLKTARTTPSLAGAGGAPSMSTSTRIFDADCAKRIAQDQPEHKHH